MKPLISETFADQTVLLTGATGFLGKLLLEKLLRSCPQVKKIFIIARNKKGKDIIQRKKELFDNEIFDLLKRKTKEIFENKVEFLYGDFTMANLGLSEEDAKKLIAETNFVFHLAATVRFDEKIKTAVTINIKATRDLLRMAKQMTDLKGFVYVSTAYSFCPKSYIEEKFYDPPHDVDKIINLVENLDEDLLNYLTPKLLKEWPNTYVLTKSLAENVVRNESEGIPLAIVRPSIVMSTFEEPLTGWSDNLYGATGAIVGAGLGLIRTSKVILDYVSDMVPADYVINCIIAAAWDVINDKEKSEENNPSDIKIYNIVSFGENPITYRKFYKLAKVIGSRYPSKNSIWYYFFIAAENERQYKIFSFFLHTLPAHCADVTSVILGKKPLLVDGYKKISKFLNVINYFSSKQWKFEDGNTQKLWKSLSTDDKTNFPFNIKSLSWEDYFEVCIRGARVYLGKEPMDTLEEGLAHYRKLKIIHYTFIIFLLLLTFSFICFGILKLI